MTCNLESELHMSEAAPTIQLPFNVIPGILTKSLQPYAPDVEGLDPVFLRGGAFMGQSGAFDFARGQMMPRVWDCHANCYGANASAFVKESGPNQGQMLVRTLHPDDATLCTGTPTSGGCSFSGIIYDPDEFVDPCYQFPAIAPFLNSTHSFIGGSPNCFASFRTQFAPFTPDCFPGCLQFVNLGAFISGCASGCAIGNNLYLQAVAVVARILGFIGPSPIITCSGQFSYVTSFFDDDGCTDPNNCSATCANFDFFAGTALGSGSNPWTASIPNDRTVPEFVWGNGTANVSIAV